MKTLAWAPHIANAQVIDDDLSATRPPNATQKNIDSIRSCNAHLIGSFPPSDPTKMPYDEDVQLPCITNQHYQETSSHGDRSPAKLTVDQYETSTGQSCGDTFFASLGHYIMKYDGCGFRCNDLNQLRPGRAHNGAPSLPARPTTKYTARRNMFNASDTQPSLLNAR